MEWIIRILGLIGRALRSVWLVLTWPRRALDRRRLSRLAAAQARAAAEYGWHVVYVRHVYQRARTGTKAWIEFDANGAVCDAWLWHFRARRGMALLVRASEGWGEHHQRDTTYIGGPQQGGIVEVLPRGTRKAVRRVARCERRARRRIAFMHSIRRDVERLVS